MMLITIELLKLSSGRKHDQVRLPKAKDMGPKCISWYIMEVMISGPATGL